MDKIRNTWKHLSLKKSLLLCILLFVLLDLGLSSMAYTFCSDAVDAIYDSYPFSGEKYYLTTADGKQLGEGAYIGTGRLPLSERDERLVSFLQFLPVAAVPFYSALCIMAAAVLFYRSKLKKPLAELKTASEKIAQNDLNFTISYDSRDELGELCASYETMRATLAENFSEMWRQMEERKRLNAAFAHELRTPLTVLKGYNEMLLATSPGFPARTAAAMGRHISRLEHYADSMSHLQRLEDARPEYRNIALGPFLASLQESAALVCRRAGKELILPNGTSPAGAAIPEGTGKILLPNHISPADAVVDTKFISQVSGNLIANAVRFAATSVTLLFEETENGLLLSVSDDGNGFDENELPRATNPFFRGKDTSEESQHFGLGLYICKLLCERHGGCLRIENLSAGARVTAYFQFGNTSSDFET